MAHISSGMPDATITGTDKSNLIQSSGTHASIDGGDGNDTIYTSGYLSTVHGGADSDIFFVRRSYIAAFGDEGNDIFQIDASPSEINVNIANITLTGGDGIDAFHFRPHNHTIFGAIVTDFDPDNEVMYFYADDKEPIKRYITYDTDDNGDLVIHNANETINFTLKNIKDFSAIENARLEYADYNGNAVGSTTFGRELSGKNVLLEGTDDADNLYDTEVYSSIVAYEGADTVYSYGYMSTVDGGAGADWIYAFRDYTSVNGGADDDFLYANAQNSNSFGAPRLDALNVTMTGGDGSDNFILAASANTIGCSVIITDFNTADGDNILFMKNDIASIHLLPSLNADGDLVFQTSDGLSDFTLKDIKDFSSIADRYIYYYSFSGSYIGAKTFEEALIPYGVTKTDSSAYISSLYSGDIWLDGWDIFNDKISWADSSIVTVDARDAVNVGGVLAGNANDNLIYASGHGNQLWGGTGGIDTLLGGNGADVFWAGESDGKTHIENCSASDLIYLWDIDSTEILSGNVSFNGDSDGVNVNVGDEKIITVRREENASATNVQLNDGSIWRYNYSSGNGQLITVPKGLRVEGKTVKVTSRYAGDLWLYNSDGWGSNYSTIIDASDDDGVRILAGSGGNDSIRAGRNGSTLWGGVGGKDTLVGGDGKDVFCVSKNENNILIDNCLSSDLVYLEDINFSDLKYLITWLDLSDFYITIPTRATLLVTNDGNFIGAQANTSASTIDFQFADRWAPITNAMMNFRFADGSTMRYNADDNVWQKYDSSNDTWQAFSEVNGMPVGLIPDNHSAYIFSDYVGNFSLDNLNDSSIINIDATNDTLSGRVLIGDEQSNIIYANNYDSSIDGRCGANNLYSGLGNDTFCVDVNVDGNDGNIIHRYADNDVVFLKDFTSTDFRSEDNTISFNWWTDGTTAILKNEEYVVITYVANSTAATTYLLADGAKCQINGSAGIYEFFIPLESGLTRHLYQNSEGSKVSVLVTEEYEGALFLDDLAYSHSTNPRFSAITDIDAREDTTVGRLLVGNENDNRIYANDYDSSLWGGIGGNDTLYGGAGSDVFGAGLNDGSTDIVDCADDDLVLLWNINLNDLSTRNMIGRNSGVKITLDDDSTINIARANGATITNMQFADGSKRSYNYSTSGWE